MEIKTGCQVRLSLKCEKTKKEFGMNDSMKLYCGTIQTVQDVYDYRIQIKGWDWHINDLMLINKSPQKKIPITHFNPEYLEV